MPDREAETLHPIMESRILPGTEIYCDIWKAYRGITNLKMAPPHRLLTVIHGRNSVDPTTNACTNGVENM